MDKKNKVDMLNILRIIAFLCIFILHTKIFVPVAWDEGISMPWLMYTPAWGGVWIFLFLAGYGIGAGFLSKKYEMTINGVYRYYVSRLKGIIPMYWFYIFVVSLFMCPSILLPRRENIQKLLSLLCFDYLEEFNGIEYGLSWYLTTLIRLYFIAPIFYFVIKKWINTKRKAVISFILIICIGFFARIIMGYHISLTGEYWEACIYKPFYFNLDIFYAGFMLNYLKVDRVKGDISIFSKIVSVLALILLLMYNSYIYYYGNCHGNTNYMKIYYYLLPTVYIIIVAVYIYCFDVRKQYLQTSLGINELKKNPVRIFDYFRNIQMPMYLFHPTVMLCLKNGYIDEKYYFYALHLGANEANINFYKGIIYTLFVFIYTIIWSIIISKLFSGSKSKIWECIYAIDVQAYYNVLKKKMLNVLKRVFPL